MKSIISFFILLISTLTNDFNVGFLMNQKNACIIQGTYISDESIISLSIEQWKDAYD